MNEWNYKKQSDVINLYNKRQCPSKNEPQQGISYLEREGEGMRERGGQAGEQVSRQAFLRFS